LPIPAIGEAAAVSLLQDVADIWGFCCRMGTPQEMQLFVAALRELAPARAAA
jgi:hypothetical protein